MANVQDRREQISVPISAEVRAAIERVAADEHRTLAGQIRHWVFAGLAEQLGAKRQSGQQAA